MGRIGIISLLLAFSTLITGAAVAQGPGAMGMGPGGPGPGGMGMGSHHGPFGAWWKNSEVVKELQLTDAQVKQIEQTFLDYRLKLIDLRADVERQETKLQPLLEADQPNEQQVGSQVDAVVAARGRLEKTNTMMMLAIRRVLSVEQWKKLQTIQHRHGEGRMRPGMGPDRHDDNFRGPRRGDGPPPPPDGPPAPGAPGDK
ncbi:MAG TPA: periplasmic heavy metal sensor [Terriglobales bacterium]|nr:periplasmic heavy metal sensor [Terriglobales bacterium]